MLRSISIAVILAAAVALAQPVLAQKGGKGQGGDRADGVPLSRIVDQIRGQQGGEAVSIKFSNGAYTILWRTPDGQLQRYVADAKSGRVSKR
ncbi:MAG: PepSY domain-containing protein [Minwuia sp.]|uniref:PepSY domain-containing protein n=1 Tax=Minwuia sp. TaxID=2493630 RepID=UPI003A8C523A